VAANEAPVAPEAAAAEAAVAEAETAVTEPAVVTEPTASEPTASEAAVAEAETAVATKATVAEATVAEAVTTAMATPGRRGDVHWADYSRYRRRRGGVSCRGSTENHCAGHRACADCAGGDPAGRSE